MVSLMSVVLENSTGQRSHLNPRVACPTVVEHLIGAELGADFQHFEMLIPRSVELSNFFDIWAVQGYLRQIALVSVRKDFSVT